MIRFFSTISVNTKQKGKEDREPPLIFFKKKAYKKEKGNKISKRT